ncbi:hypothetical protein [Hoeflea sp.]|uniref:hypothetical protein n=1 Tax=Hoeflea sp. TaxID=1940281 RepID=UPI003B0177EE
MADLNWMKCGSGAGVWCSFMTMNLNSITANRGVYMIWHDGNPGRVVYVGQGNIASRLQDHRSDHEIIDYARSGTLRVTWASAPESQLDGIERHLADTWHPLVGDAHPNAVPIAVNSPFG